MFRCSEELFEEGEERYDHINREMTEKTMNRKKIEVEHTEKKSEKEEKREMLT